MAKWVVSKASRFYRRGPGYMGPACTCARVTPGKVFHSKARAKDAARRLTECNPVGFTVHKFRPSKKR